MKNPQYQKETMWQQEEWKAWQKVLFRFGFAYLAMYILPNFISFMYGFIFLGEFNLMKGLVLWVGKTFLSIESIHIMPNGSGDTTYNYVEVFTIFSLALIISFLWSPLDLKRMQYRQLLYWLSVGVRYMLGMTMLSYGLVKVFKTQFPDTSLVSLLTPFGEMSPMGLLWRFMGYSVAYNIFTGLGEVIGGLLLFFRRTTTLGAMLLIAVLSNVVILNFAYDIPVKLFSSHLLLMALLLFLLDSRRVLNLLVFNRPVQPMVHPLPFKTKKEILAGRIIKTLVLLALVGGVSFQSVSMYNALGKAQPKPPLFGIYEVQLFVRNQDTIAVEAVRGARWKRMIVDTHDQFHIQDMRDNFNYYVMKTDTSARTFSIFSSAKDKVPLYDFTYTLDANKIMRLNGIHQSDSLFIELKRKDYNDFLLTNRGFHWVNEQPFSR